MIRRLILLMTGLILSCSGQSQIARGVPKPQEAQPAGNAQLVIYARLGQSQIGDYVWKIRKIALRRKDGNLIAVSDRNLTVRASDYDHYQRLLLVSDFPAGQYEGMTIFTQ
ncbi:MAG TPA: hypothetical protein ENI46_00805, partial [Firmicutes bacterium]|nr:hypothetical protein [Bacillota bacterium]